MEDEAYEGRIYEKGMEKRVPRRQFRSLIGSVAQVR